MTSTEAPPTLTLDEIKTLVQDDVAYWMDNPFMDRAALTEKVRWWITQAVAEAQPETGPNSPQHMLLLAYSEWLDGEGLVKPDHEVPSDSGGSYVVDDRPHDQLVADFLEQHKAGA